MTKGEATKEGSEFLKIRTIVCKEGLSLMNRILAQYDDLSYLHIPLGSAVSYLVDAYYNCMLKMFNSLGNEKPFTELEELLEQDSRQKEILAARFLGVSLGIVLTKAADLSNKKVRKTAVKEFVQSFKNIDDSIEKEICKMAITYIDFDQDEECGARTENGFASHDLGLITYSLINKELKQEDFANLSFAIEASLALVIAYKRTSGVELAIEKLESSKLIM